jgi:hypothetical protein
MREQQPILKKLKLILMFNPLLEWIDTIHVMRLWTRNRSVKAGEHFNGNPEPLKRNAIANA